MKKETIITAVVFLVVGFLAGYITAQLRSDGRPRATAASGENVEAATPTGAGAANATEQRPAGLPEGHPPLQLAAQMRALEEQANQNPTDPKPRLGLANLLYDNRMYERAIEWYQRALELDPKNLSARTDLGTAYFYGGRAQDALREYRKSLEIDPDHGPTLYNLIIVNLDGTRDLDAAQRTWERLHKKNPDYPGLDDLKRKLDAARAGSMGAAARR